MKTRTVVIAAVIFLALLAAACGSSSGGTVKLASVSMLPANMQRAPQRVREAYQFAAANPEALKNVPCYCGCGAIGHTSNFSCYIKDTKSDGSIVFDEHGLGCSLCVDIAQDVMRLTRAGKSPVEVRQTIIADYGKFGPPTQ